MKNVLKPLVLALAGLSFPASAGTTLFGLEYSISQYDLEFFDVDDGDGYKLFAAYQFDEVPLNLELGYLKVSDAEIEDFGFGLGFNGASLGLAYRADIGPTNGSSLWIRGGYYRGDSGFGDSTVTFSKTSSGLVIGLGIDWLVTRNFGFRAEVENYFRVRDFETSLDSKSDVLILSLGMIFGLSPEISPAPTTDSTRVAPSPPESEPGLVEETTPAPAAAPVAAPAPPPASPDLVGQTIQLNQPLNLRGRPVAGSEVSATVPAGESVAVVQSISNSDGKWYYLRGGSASGWVLAEDLAAAR